MASNNLVDQITRESWIMSAFPEWGTWLNEEIEAEQVAPGTFALWWLGCMGVWLKTHEGTHVCIDLWCKAGKQTQKEKLMKKQHQHQRMIGCVNLQPNLRNSPCVIDPFAINDLHALFATHDHSDHIDPNVAAAVVKNCASDIPFIGPESCTALWKKWGVSEARCRTVAPGDVVKIRDLEIVVLESFDRTELVTSDSPEPLKNTMPMDMNRKSVSYLIKTSGGNFYHAGDSHYSNYFAKHGNDHAIDVAVGAYGENPRGITDKMTSVDILRMAECLRTQVVIPLHHDIWTNFQADTREILMLWELKRRRLRYAFNPFIWQVGGKFTYPNDKNLIEFQYRRGFEDAFAIEPDLPFPAML